MSHVSPSSRFSGFWTARPITLGLAVVLIGLHIAVHWTTTPDHDRNAAYRNLGMLQIEQSPEHPELFGPFDLWEGEWWRIPLGGLHHAGWWSLGFGVAAFVYLGGFLESKISRASYACFLLGTLFATTMPRWLGAGSVPAWFGGNGAPTGIWGLAFALLGALVWLRRNDRRLSREFGEGAILLGIIVGLGSMAFSTIGLATRVDNLAHLAGLPYGFLWGVVLSTPQMARYLLVPAFVAAHIFLWPLIDGLMHPVENGRYHWWLAEQSDDPDLKKARYQLAIQRDPELPHPWLALAELEFQNHQPEKAWQILLEGLEKHPNLQSSEKLSWRIWSEFSTPDERQAAWREAERKIADDSLDWSRQLLSPDQSAAHLLEENEPLGAWRFLMQHLRGFPPPPDGATARSQLGEVAGLVEKVWQQLETQADRLAALQILDEQLGQSRRAWHLAMIPRRDLIPHYQHLGEAMWAWELLIQELRDDSTFHQAGKPIAGEIWRMFPTELRRQRARKLVDDVFGPLALHWQIELGILSDAVKRRYRLDQSVNLPAEPNEPKEQLTPIHPDDPESAAMGRKL